MSSTTYCHGPTASNIPNVMTENWPTRRNAALQLIVRRSISTGLIPKLSQVTVRSHHRVNQLLETGRGR